MSINKGRNSPEFFLYKQLRNPLNGSSEMTVDGSGTAVAFEYTVPTGKDVELHRFLFDLVDGAIKYGQFAGLATELTNGVKIEIIDADGTTVLVDFTDGHNVKSNSHWSHVAGIDSIIQPAAGDDGLPIRFSIFKANTDGFGMYLSEGRRVRVTVQDDLTTVSHFECTIQGKIY